MEPKSEIKSTILNNIYDKFGTPKGDIILERVYFYPGWNAGNVQRGRTTIFTQVYDHKLGYTRMVIVSYFMRALKNKVLIYNTSKEDDKPDLVIKLKDTL